MADLKKYPNPILKKRAEEVKEVTPEIKELFWDMLEVMIAKQGSGISAPQIGVSKRVIAVKMERGPEVFINPRILRKSRKTEIVEEGCLSFPTLYFKIKRAKEVEVRALNDEGVEVKIKTQGLPARVFQHEIDHLNGILFTDRISFWQRLKIRKKLRELEKECRLLKA